MTVKLVSMVCNCLSKVACACTNFLNWNRNIKISEQDLAEWKRIEGIDQYITPKRPWS